MKSTRPKVLHTIAGRPMIDYVIDTALTISTRKPIVVVGFGAAEVQNTLGDRVEYALQAEQKGTGHAVQQAADKIAQGGEHVVLIYGDGPFLTASTLQHMLAEHQRQQAVLTLLTLQPVDMSNNYGRIIRDEGGNVTGIIEYKELAPHQRLIDEVNAGPVCYETHWLLEHLPQLKPQAGHGELYLTDLVALAAQAGATIATYPGTEIEAMGINDRVELSRAEHIMQDKINRQWMLNGVTLIDPARTYIEASVTIWKKFIPRPAGTVIRSVPTAA